MPGAPPFILHCVLLILDEEGALPFVPFVQFHDILSILFRDILYTPARAKRARERTKGCHSEP
jgi:hypothetical protein